MSGVRIACIGECMIELNQIDLDEGVARVGFAGDTLNTAIYLARLGCDVAYVTNLGTDAFSTRMMQRFAAEGVDCRLIGRHDSRIPGLYAIETDPQGERSFRYWRDASAARTLFSGVGASPVGASPVGASPVGASPVGASPVGASPVGASLVGASLVDLWAFDVIYLSGITLAILPPQVRAALTDTARALKDAGKRVVFDTNHRPRLWPDAATARESFDAMWRATSLGLPSYDDEERLYPGLSALQVTERIAACGVAEVVLKNGAQGPAIRWQGQTVQTALPKAARVVDTSGAGDSFNAGYLAARLRGEDPLQAAEAGHRLASVVIGYHGAVIPRAAMPNP